MYRELEEANGGEEDRGVFSGNMPQLPGQVDKKTRKMTVTAIDEIQNLLTTSYTKPSSLTLEINTLKPNGNYTY
jgi:hypothetical protein